MNKITQGFNQVKLQKIVSRLLGVFISWIAVILLLLGGMAQVNAQRTVTFTGANASWTAPADMTLVKAPSQSAQLISCLSGVNVSYPSNNSSTGYIQITLNSTTEKIDKINIIWRSAAANQVAPIIFAQSATFGTVGGVGNVITATNGGFKTTAVIAASGGTNCPGEDVVFPATATVKTVLIPRLMWTQDAGSFSAGTVYGSFLARLNNGTSTGYSTGFGNQTGQYVGQIIVSIVPDCTAPNLTYNLTGGTSVCSGTPVTLGLSNSETNVSYQLYNGATPVGSLVPGTGSSISFAAVSPTTPTTYSVKAIGTAGTYCTTETAAFVSTATITIKSVSAAPVVSSPIFVGATSVSGTSTEADGTSVEVFVNGTTAGTTTVTGGSWSITLAALTLADAVTANATALGKCLSVVSNSVTVSTVCVAPIFSTQPTDNQTVCLGGTAPTLGTVVADQSPIYQWYVVGTKTNTGGTAVSTGTGGNTATYTPVSTTAGTYYYYCVATNGGCTTASNAVQFTVNAPTITLDTNPSVTIGATTANLTYSATTGTPTQYAIDWDATANSAGLTDVALTTLPVSPIVLNNIPIPNPAIATIYNGTLTVTAGGCVSVGYSISVTVNLPPSQATDYFRSKTTATTWTAAGTWESSADGINYWVPAAAPTASAKGIEITAGSTVTLGAALTTPLPTVNTSVVVNGTLTTGTAAATNKLTLGSDMIVNAGGALAIDYTTSTAAMLVTTGYKLTVLGTLTNVNPSTTAITSSATTLLFASATGAGTYTLGGAGLQVPTATWSVANGSGGTNYGTANINTSAVTPTYSTPTGTYGDIVFAATNATCKPFLLANSGITFHNMTVSSGNYQMTTSTGPITVNVTGDFSQSAGTFLQGGYAVTTTLNVSGNFAINGGAYKNSFAGITSSINVGGNFSVALGASFTQTNANTYTVTFNGTTPQTITNNGTISGVIDYVVNNGAGVSLGSDLASASKLSLTAGNLTLGANNLTVTNAVLGTPAASNHIVTNGAGKVKYICAASGTYTFPVGYSTGTYNPVTITNNSASSLTYNVLAKATSPTLLGSLSVMWDITGATVSSTFAFPWGAESITDPTVYRYNGSSDWNSISGATTASSITTLTGATSNIAGQYWTIATGPTTWTGTALGGSWSNGIPIATIEAIIVGVFDTSLSTGGGFTAKKLTVSSGGSLTIKTGTCVTIKNEVINNADANGITVEDSASLVQVNDAAPVNTGTINYSRNTTAISNLDYTYWSSPVANFTLGGVSPNTLAGKFFSYDSSIDDWKKESSATVMTAGIGYIVRGPETGPYMTPNPPSLYQATFTGVPNNGPYQLTGIVADRSYLLGNPYPSALDADTFLAANVGVLDGTLYFWTHNTPIGTGVSNPGSGYFAYSQDDYASYNGTGGVATLAAASSGVGKVNNNVPSGKIASGQGFFASSIVVPSVTTINYNNSMRVGVGGITGNNSQFFKTKNSKAKTTNSIEKNRVWLNLTNSQGLFKQLLVGYVTGATNDNESHFDGESFNANKFANFYSINQNKKLVIQGRALPFDENDEVPLGFETIINGSLVISIDQTDGLLVDQEIFLEDMVTNTVTNLKTSSYTFNTSAGKFNDRFVLHYTDKTLGVKDMSFDENSIVIYKNNDSININAGNVVVANVKVYDIQGKLITEQKNVNATTTTIKNLKMTQEVLLVKITSEEGVVVTKKVVN